MTISIDKIADIQFHSISELESDPKIKFNDKEFTVKITEDGKFSVSRENASFASSFKSFYGGNTSAKQLQTMMNKRLENSEAIVKALPNITQQVEAKLLGFDDEDTAKIEKAVDKVNDLKEELKFYQKMEQKLEGTGTETIGKVRQEIVRVTQEIVQAEKIKVPLLSSILNASVAHVLYRLTSELQAQGFKGDNPVCEKVFEQASQMIIENKEAYGLGQKLDGSEVGDIALMKKLTSIWSLPKSQLKEGIDVGAELAKPVKGVYVRDTGLYDEHADIITKKYTGSMLADVMGTLKDVSSSKEVTSDSTGKEKANFLRQFFMMDNKAEEANITMESPDVKKAQYLSGFVPNYA